MPNMYFCSDRSRVSEATIKRRYSESLREKHEGTHSVICECCGQRKAVHNDHTIARARCKVIKKTELIWNRLNYVSSCEQCHREWENFKSGQWLLHINCSERLLFLKEHDPNGFTVRVNITKLSLEENLQETFTSIRQQQNDTGLQSATEASID